MFPRNQTPEEAAASSTEKYVKIGSEEISMSAIAKAERALQITERFCSFRARCKPYDMLSLFHPQASLVSINNVVFGPRAIYSQLEDGQRFTHLTKWYKPWVVCQSTVNDPKRESNIVTLEREGRIFVGMWFWDSRYILVRETCVVEDEQIKVFSTQRKF